MIDITDSAGGQRFAGMLDHWIRYGNILCVCLDITRAATWKCVELYRRKILCWKLEERNWAMILVSTKGDLEKYRQVPRNEGVRKSKAMEYTTD